MKKANRSTSGSGAPSRIPTTGFLANATRLVVCGLGALATVGSVQAQGIFANAQISGAPAGGGVYSYTIVLNNLPGSSSPIQTFWYAWVPGADFLPSSPTSVQPPAGWNGSVQGGPYYDPYYGYYYPDGYSIQFSTMSSPLEPGSSISFGFTSSDSPAALAGNSPIFYNYPVGTSFVYGGVGPYGNSAQFVVESVVPEPSALNLLAVGCVGFWIVGWSRRQLRTKLAFAKIAPEHPRR